MAAAYLDFKQGERGTKCRQGEGPETPLIGSIKAGVKDADKYFKAVGGGGALS